MTKKLISKTKFTTGEISPRLLGRISTTEYEGALEEATNGYITSHGPINRRNGTQYVSEVRDSSAAVKLFRYQISRSVAYMLEVGNVYMRVYRNGSQVLESDLTITGITAADPAVVTSTGHDLSDGDHVYITGVVGMTEVNNSVVPYLVNNKTANTFELQSVAGVDLDASAFTAYSSGGVINRIFEITSPYTTAQLDEIQVRQRGTTMYIVHPDVAPRTLVRSSDTSWALDTITFEPPPTYESGLLSSGFTMTPSATTGLGIDFTSSSAIFKQGDVGRRIMNLTDGETGSASIISITSTTVAVCDIITDFTDTNAIASDDWKIDLSPLCDLKFDDIQAGAVTTVDAFNITGSYDDPVVITGVTKANPGVVTTSTSHLYAEGRKVLIEEVEGMTQLNGNIYTVGTKTATTFQLKDDLNVNVNTSAYTTYASDGIVRKGDVPVVSVEG